MAWREGPEDTQDTSGMGDWERESYDYARAAVTRGHFLKAAGLGVGALLLAPLETAGARTGRATGVLRESATTLTVGRLTPSTNLDPQRTAGLADFEIMSQIFDTLLYADNHGNIYPGLATAWNFNRSGRVIKLKLRRSVTFHDGTPFDASAVKASMDRWVAAATASPTAKSVAGPLLATKVVDRYTVALSYSTKFAPVLINLASTPASIVSPTAVEKFGAQFGRNPVGTGPYSFVSWSTDNAIALQKNPAHKWATPFYVSGNGKPLSRGPAIDTVVVRVIPDDSTRIAALQSGEIDMVYGSRAVPANQVSALRASRDQVRQVASNNVFFHLNAARPPLTDARVRQALSHAIDRKALVRVAFSGEAAPGTSVLGSYLPDHDPSVAKYATYDPKKAKALLKAAGQENGFSMDFLIYNVASDAQKLAAQIMQQNLAQVGVTLNINIVPVSSYLNELRNTPLTQKSHAFLDGSGSVVDGGSNLTLLFHSGGLYCLFNDPTLDALLDQQAITTNPKNRRLVLFKIQQRMAVMGYAQSLYEDRATLVARNAVHNVHLDWKAIVHYQEMTRS
jgi:peptide/nickel transport system substrate-binding protein